MRSGDVVEVTNVELFFDLVYVFAITQLSHRLATHTSVESAVQTAILLGLVWQAWAYTTWVTNWVDPDRLPTRAMLLAVMLASLLLSAGLPRAFADRGLLVAGAYAAIQIGRSVFAVFAVRGHRLQRNFERILAWCVISGVALIVGSRTHGHAREAIWLAAVAFDFLGGRVGFWTPVLGRSTTDEWTISGNHFAERCEAFVIIALGESVVAIGTTLSATARLTAAQVVTFVVAFAGTVGLWWVYFDRVAESGARAITRAADPGRLGSRAYHLVHPVIIGGIIAAAAGDNLMLAHPGRRGHWPVTLLLAGGFALFLGGHGLFKAIAFHVVPWSRIAGIAVLALLVAVSPYLTALALGIGTVLAVAVVAVADRLQHPVPAQADGRRDGP
jgi:low temperature requirement protein LtrA